MSLTITNSGYTCDVCRYFDTYKMDMLEHYKTHSHAQLKAVGLHTSRIEHSIFMLTAQWERNRVTHNATRKEK